MKALLEAGLLITFVAPTVTMAQSGINGRWKLDAGTLPPPSGTLVWLLQDGKLSVQVVYAAD